MITHPLVSLAGSVARLYRLACAWRSRQSNPSRYARGLAVVLAWMSLFWAAGDLNDNACDLPQVELICRTSRRGGAP